MKKLKVTRTETAFYTPDFEEDFYKSHGIRDIEHAAEIDLTYLRDGMHYIDDLLTNECQIQVSYNIEVVEVSDDATVTS